MRHWYLSLAAVVALLPAANKLEEQAKFLAGGADKMLVARRCATCHAAGNFTKFRKSDEQCAKDEARSLVSHRDSQGPFKDFDDLPKVPGLDPKKLEAKRSLLAY